MATTPYDIYGGLDVSMKAGASFASSQFYAVELTSTEGQVTVCNNAGDTVFGIIQDNPASGAASSIRVQGVTKWVAGAAVSIGDVVGTDASGKAVTKTAANGTKGAGRALTAAAADGDIISVLLTPGVYTSA